MNTKPYVFAAAATVSIIVCFLSYSGTTEEKLLPPSVVEPINVFYDSEFPPELSASTESFGYSGMSDVLKELDAKVQKFSLDPSMESTINGSMGTRITFPPNALVDELGNPPSGVVKIALYEYYDVQEILAAKLATKSGDRLLESAGMIKIEATCNGKKLKIRDGAACEMKFPRTEGDLDFKLFNGRRDGSGVMDWELADDEGEGSSMRVLDGSYIAPREGSTWEEGGGGDGESETSSLNLDCFIQIVSSYRRDLFSINTMDFYEWKFSDIPQDLNTYFLANFNPDIAMLDDFCSNKLTCEIKVTLRQDGTVRNAMVTKSCRPDYDLLFMDFVTNLPVLDMDQMLKKPDDNNAFVLRFGKANGTNKIATVAKFRNQYKGKEDEKMESVSATDLNFYVFNSSELGWINCDRFMEAPTEMVQVNVTSSLPDSCYVSMVFEDMNSVLLGRNVGDKIVFNDVPKGKKVRIVSIRCVNGRPDISTIETTTSTATVKLEKYQPLTLARLDEEFKGFMQ